MRSIRSFKCKITSSSLSTSFALDRGVGLTVSQAEAYVNDLAAASEGTRRVEVEEQAVARRCVASLNELHSAIAREEMSSAWERGGEVVDEV